MAQDQKKSTTGIKFLFASISLAGILGLWSAFASKAQLATAEASNNAKSALTGQIFMPEMPTLVPIIDLSNQVNQLQPASVQQNLRSVSVPTPVVGQTPPPISVQRIIVGNSSGNSAVSGGSTGSAAAPAASTGSSK
jgi:hypothetical protein